MDALQAARRQVRSPPAKVRLLAWTQDPFALAVASARTCYAADFVFQGRLDKKGERQRTTLEQALPGEGPLLSRIGRYDTPHDERIRLVHEVQSRAADADTRAAVALFADLARQRAAADAALAKGIYDAGHHTPFQHPTFVFGLENVSRNLVESFLHNHTFYNSEQQSQRYVEMREAEVFVPATVRADPAALALYEEAVRGAYDAYHDLRQTLVARTERTMAAIGRLKGQSDKEVHKEAEKKAQEWARYVVPVAAHTQLYHTVSGIVLLRYARMARAAGVDEEAAAVVQAMLDEVRRVDPGFLSGLADAPHPAGTLPEQALLASGTVKDTTGRLVPAADRPAAADPALGASASPRRTGADEMALDGHRHALLVRATPEAPQLVADALREVTGATLGDAAMLEAALDTARNPVWNDTLNTWDHSPALRTLRHVHYTFRKRLSLTAFAQDQRHRLTPASRPLLATVVRRLAEGHADTYTPELVAADAAALARYTAALASLHAAIAQLRLRGVPDDDCAYLLPNATNLVFTQTGDLLSLIHKWRLRLCFNAQKEIFDASLEELRQVQALHPGLTRWIGPPCSFVAAHQPAELQDSVEACCPEGPRWCGVKVWRNFDAQKGVPKRPY